MSYLITHVMGGEVGIYGEADTREEAEQIKQEALKEGGSCVEIEQINWERVES